MENSRLPNRRYSVLYVNLRGSPSYNKIAHEQIIRGLNDFFSKLLEKGNGSLKRKIDSIVYDKFLGDGFLCAFKETSFVDALTIAICLQVFSHVYKFKSEGSEYSNTEVRFKIGIEFDYMTDMTQQILSSPLLHHLSRYSMIHEAPVNMLELWGDTLDALRLANFAEQDQILVGEEYYSLLTSATLQHLGLGRTESLKNLLQTEFNYEKDGRTRSAFRLSLDLTRDDIKSLLGNPDNFDDLIPISLPNLVIGDRMRDVSTGILVHLADEKPILRRYYDGIIGMHKLKIKQVVKGTYRLQHDDAHKIYQYLFQNSDYYMATTILKPSEYNASYQLMLEEHKKLAKQAREKNLPNNNLRMIIHNEKDLIYDFLTHEDAWSEFLNIQKDEDGYALINVKWIDKDQAEQLYENKYREILNSTDVGVWFSEREEFNYSAQWEIDKSVEGAPKGEFLLTSKKEDLVNIFTSTQEFLKSIQTYAKSIDVLLSQASKEKAKYDENLYNFSKRFEDNWQNYVNPSERKKILKPFLEPILRYYFGRDYKNRDLTMLDASSGIGCDAVALEELCPGSRIFFNESSSHLKEQAVNWLRNESGTKSAEKVEVTSTPWELLNVRYSNPRGYFDVILLLGNFISRGKNLDVIREYLGRFKSLLKPNGVLVIDHRNYDRILREMHNKDTYFEEFVNLHRSNSGLYRGFGPGGTFSQGTLDIDTTKKKLTIRFDGKNTDEPLNEEADISMVTFTSGEFYQIVKDIFEECDIKRCFDYKSPNLLGATKDNNDEFVAAGYANFIIYIIGNT